MHPNPHDHIAGWGAEVHFLYVSTELFLFAILIWPRGWDLAWRTLGGALAVLVLLVTWLWDRNLVGAERGFDQNLQQ